jgi:hypothetical protein
VTLNGLKDQFLQTLPDSAVNMSVLVGDITGNGSINATDIALPKAQTGTPVSGANFRTDVTANGAINASDIAIVKLHSGEALP